MAQFSRAHVVIDQTLLHEVDRSVGPRKRSQFISQAVQKELDRLKFLRAVQLTKGAWKDKDHPELRRGAVRWVSSLRKEENRIRRFGRG